MEEIKKYGRNGFLRQKYAVFSCNFWDLWKIWSGYLAKIKKKCCALSFFNYENRVVSKKWINFVVRLENSNINQPRGKKKLMNYEL